MGALATARVDAIKQPKRGLIIFDADDTLWVTAPLFASARADCRAIVAAAGVDPQRWEDAQVACDLDLASTYHFSREQFPAACELAYRQLVTEAGRTPDAAVAAAVYARAARVFSDRAVNIDGVEDVLADLSSDYTLVLLTRGERPMQLQRLLGSGLRKYFKSVHVVGEKRPTDFQAIRLRERVSAAETWSVGNSYKSDLKPALAAGLNAILIPVDTWAYDREPVPNDGSVRIVESLRQLARIIRGPQRASLHDFCA